jgi:hypothetical protein
MPNALAIAHKFEQFVTLYGDDPYISKTISKMVSTRVAKLNKELKAVQQTLTRFERIYCKTSDVFFKEYQAGTAGDDMDFIEWSSLVMMRDRLLAERAALQA